MNFLTLKQTAEKWGITANRISILAKEGRIPGAVKIGLSWMIPENTEKPLDGRTKTAKEEKKEDFFRYPIFEHRDLSSFNPPLTDEELIIKNALEAFYACRFEEGDKILGDLPECAENRYIRIFALRLGCAADIFLLNTDRFYKRYGRICAELKEDFPHKKEMEECIHELDSTIGESEYYKNGFNVVPDYPYHESFLPHLTSLSAISLSFADGTLSLKEIKAQEVNCIYLERENALVDLQSMHIYLGCAYALLQMHDEMTYHFKKALLIAEKYDLFYAPALQYFYMRKPMSYALKGFPEDFKKKLTKLSENIHKQYLAFVKKANMNTIYRILPRDDYFLLYAAVQGHTNKEIAKLLRVSVSTIGNRYIEIYSTLGVKNKQKMVELYNNLLNGKPTNNK